MSRSFGAVDLDRWDLRNGAYPAHLLIGSAKYPRNASLASLIVPGVDQAERQKCVGCMAMQLVHVRSRKLGLTPITPSDDAIYYQARARKYGWQNVWDGGCNPHDAFASIRDHGMVPRASLPQIGVNSAPPVDCFVAAADLPEITYRWVLTEGQARTDETCALISQGYAVGIALKADAALEDWRPGQAPWTRVGPVLGGHAVTLVAYDTMPNGRIVFSIANSWGTGWGDHGLGLLSQAAIESSETSYVITVEVGPWGG